MTLMVAEMCHVFQELSVQIIQPKMWELHVVPAQRDILKMKGNVQVSFYKRWELVLTLFNNHNDFAYQILMSVLENWGTYVLRDVSTFQEDMSAAIVQMVLNS